MKLVHNHDVNNKKKGQHHGAVVLSFSPFSKVTRLCRHKYEPEMERDITIFNEIRGDVSMVYRLAYYFRCRAPNVSMGSACPGIAGVSTLTLHAATYYSFHLRIFRPSVLVALKLLFQERKKERRRRTTHRGQRIPIQRRNNRTQVPLH